MFNNELIEDILPNAGGLLLFSEQEVMDDLETTIPEVDDSEFEDDIEDEEDDDFGDDFEDDTDDLDDEDEDI